MKIWTVTYHENNKQNVVSFAKDDHVYKFLAELIQSRLNPDVDHMDKVVDYCIRSGQHKMAFFAFHQRRASNITIIENELRGHIME